MLGQKTEEVEDRSYDTAVSFDDMKAKFLEYQVADNQAEEFAEALSYGDFADNLHVLNNAAMVEYCESLISEGDDLYLFTWSPDPAQLPDVSFYYQHLYCVNAVASFIQSCECGLACVESNQQGFPHYHGWYQTSDSFVLEQMRIVNVKVFKKLGNFKCEKVKQCYRINSYTKQGNALYYYKADLFGQQCYTQYNLISKLTHDDTDWQEFKWYFVVNPKRKTYQAIQDAVNRIKSVKDFYKSKPI